MSALGQKQTFALQKAMSALPPKADIGQSLGKSALILLFLVRQRLKHGAALVGWPKRLDRRCELDHFVKLLPRGSGATGR